MLTQLDTFHDAGMWNLESRINIDFWDLTIYFPLMSTPN